MKFGIGQPAPRKEDPRMLTGRGRYVDDIELPRQTYGYVLRSPHAHAKITNIDTSAAEAAPGVLVVLTGDDYAADGLGEIHCHFPVPALVGPPTGSPFPALVTGMVKCVGAGVAFVVAESLAKAKDAAEMIDIGYEELPAVTTAEAALADGAPKVWEHADSNISFAFGMGDPEAVNTAIEAAAHLTKAHLINNRITTNAMETRSNIGDYDAGTESYTLYNSGQAPHVLRQSLAQDIFQIAETRIRVICPDVGGGFGMKGAIYPEDILVLWAAKKVERPVKWVADRLESFVSDAQGRDQVVDGEMAFDADGRITAIRVKSNYNVGAYLPEVAFIAPMFATLLLSGVYAIPAIRGETNAVFTNTVGTAPYRGAGRPEASYILERLIDIAATEMGKDPAELRRINLIKADQMPYQTALMHAYDCGEFDVVMDKVLQSADWDGFEKRRQDSEKNGLLRGRGISSYLEAATFFNDRMEIRFDPSGAVSVIAGTFSHGQGHETAYAQMMCEFLGVEFESVRLVQGDTDAVSIGRGTYASRSMTIGGSALRIAADKIIEKGKQIAAHILEAAAADIEFDDGNFSVTGTDKSIGIADVAKASYEPMMWPPNLDVGLEAVGDFSPGPFNFPNGCQVAEVEVDPDTGFVRLDRMYVANDVGTVINPMLLEGQMHGGLAQGIGQAMFENIVYDEDTGQLLSASFMDYAMPRANDFPHFDVDVHPIPTDTNPLGVKGAGETGTVGAPAAVMNAISDALHSKGAAPVEMPATPEKVWRALNAA
ncbi:MAG: xanthine dehydrogenase family protein molybdopterin-binding subunit [Rhodospirillaceae bacterium]|nr:xanthine dehydrogenase family protein molybdopterin-binding subunit [Rhodospirillaceae bacterium]MBT6293007.1 xanthine dehydrogenase family protein molybdopterin-binding subunit [Rhodospirillaceae bacterium]MBT7231543.1 xanthine dehydrogenase family protein molybdopterin-binding subunit [Rhodospirillaceae bacterium]MBT7571948.1 xanthine dehydrogenase family protein molybdopterin-binding subunit [Rhodospirillaceae bacterium]